MTLEKASLLTDSKTIKTRINTYSTAAKALDTEVNLLACSTLNHVIEHGDITLCNRLLDSLGKSQRKQALLRWFIDFGPMGLAPTTDKAKGSQNVVFAKGKTTHKGLDEALLKPFWEYTVDAPVKDFDLKAAYYASINALIKKTQARIEEVANGTLDASKNIIDHKFLAKIQKEVATAKG